MQQWWAPPASTGKLNDKNIEAFGGKGCSANEGIGETGIAATGVIETVGGTATTITGVIVGMTIANGARETTTTTTKKGATIGEDKGMPTSGLRLGTECSQRRAMKSSFFVLFFSPSLLSLCVDGKETNGDGEQEKTIFPGILINVLRYENSLESSFDS